MSADKTILKLNDFNRAEFMLWDEKENDYCKYGEGRGHGTVSFDRACNFRIQYHKIVLTFKIFCIKQ